MYQMSDCYCYFDENGEIFIKNINVPQAENPNRDKKLLLNKQEIKKISKNIERKGYSLIAYSLFLQNGKIKVDLKLAKGKNVADKRETIKERDDKRKMREL